MYVLAIFVCYTVYLHVFRSSKIFTRHRKDVRVSTRTLLENLLGSDLSIVFICKYIIIRKRALVMSSV